MSGSSLVMMLLVLALLWGGLVALLSVALHNERGKIHDDEGEI